MSKSSNRKHSHYILHREFSNPIKVIICLLCLNVLITSTYHVICIELSSEGISKAHLQIHDCHYPQDNGSGSFIHSDNQKTSHAVLLGSQSKDQSCPDCIDEHIQFIKAFPKINLQAASLFKTILPPIQSITNQFFYAQVVSSVPKKYSSPLSSFRSSVIRSTIMLI
jgi:ribosomal protein S27E